MRRIVPLIALVTAGCMSYGNRRAADPALYEKLVEGESTKADVIDLYGYPATTSKQGFADAWHYHFVYAKPRAQAFIPFAGPFMPNAVRSQVAYVTLVFNPETDVLTYKTITNSVDERTARERSAPTDPIKNPQRNDAGDDG